MSKNNEHEEIAKIREIVFGTQMKSYEKKFEHIQTKISNDITHITHKFESEQTKINNDISKYELQSLESFKNLTEELKQIRKVQKEHIDELKKTIFLLKDEFLNFKKETDNTFLKAQSENTKRLNEITASYISHNEFSEVLFEMSNRFSSTNQKPMKYDPQATIS